MKKFHLSQAVEQKAEQQKKIDSLAKDIDALKF